MTDLVLGIETSCDETAAAVVAGDGTIHANIVASQIEDHSRYGGVVPEVAARAHLSLIDGVIAAALEEAGVSITDLDAVAATGGPGLIGGVLVGTVTAKAIALGRNIPFHAINHLEGHALSARLTENVRFPYLLLLVSGGHTQLLEVTAPGQYRRYGTTMDDAAGEAFDKSAKILGLGMPGGPAIEKAAAAGNADVFDLPRPLRNKPGCHFSFSGLKTAVATAHEKSIAPLTDKTARRQATADLAASLQAAIADSLASRSKRAMQQFMTHYTDHAAPDFVVAGGVAANSLIRQRLEATAKAAGFAFHAPPVRLCTDNAAMIAWAAIERARAGLAPDGLDFNPRPRWPLDPDAAPPPGRGVRA